MWRGWQGTLTLAVIAITCVSAKPTTQETLVVSRSEHESSTTALASDESSTEEPVAPIKVESSTEEPVAPIKVTEMDVQSKISLRYAHTAVVTRVRNAARRAQETTFRMLLPDTAFISGFTMTIDGVAYKAYVKPKEEAKKIYSDAVSQGVGAAHIAAKARDSNHFTVSVNVEPSSSVIFNLTYEELLVRRNGVYNHAINLHPGTVVPKMKVKVHIKESEKITTLRVPEIRTGNEIDATEDDPHNPNVVIVRTHDDREAIITFTPNIEEQKNLISVYAEKSRESLGNPHRWYPEDSAEKKEKEGIIGQFVVQYDVDRAKAGEILVNDGYFVHFFAPTSLPPLPKHAVFVLDTSGSMIGRKIEQLKEAMQTILSNLHSGDYFSIVEFNSYVKVHDLKEADHPAEPTKRYYYGMVNEPTTTLVAPSQATPENIAKAKTIISRLDAGGGTNIASALDTAVDLVHHGAALDSDKKVENHTESKNDDAATTTPDNKKLEPIIIFLTDGDATVGETDPTRIVNRLTEKNVGQNKASIFSLAFGEDADRKFLRKLSLRNEGFMRHIYEAADAALQLRDFYRSVSSPLLADVRFLYPKAQIKEGSLTKHQFRTYYAGSETVVAGRVDDGATSLEPQVLAFCGQDDGKGTKRYEVSPKVPVERTSVDFYPLERLWAYLTIKQLLDEKDALVDTKESNKETKDKLEEKALDIALKYEFVTPLTSLVVVKPNATKAVNAESVDENLRSSYSRPMIKYMSSISPLSLSSFTSYRPAMNLVPSPQFSVAQGRPGLPGLAGPPTAQYGLMPVSDLTDFAYEEEDTDSDFEYHRLVGGSHSWPDGGKYSTTPTPVYESSINNSRTDEPSTTTTASDPLEEYSLKLFPWTLPLLNSASDALVLQVNGTQVTLKLTKNSVVPVSSDDTECSKATDGGEGRCVYLTSCSAAQRITAADYATTYCLVDNVYAGVCCPTLKHIAETN